MSKRLWILLSALSFVIVLSACGGDSASDTTENPAETDSVSTTTEEVVDSSATEEITSLLASNPTAVASGDTPQSEVIRANVDVADVAQGEQLYTGEVMPACTTCHLADPSMQQIAPSLVNFRDVAGSRLEGQDAYTYAYNSIRYANAYIVDGYQANIMPVYDDMLTDQEIYELIAYIWTLEE